MQTLSKDTHRPTILYTDIVHHDALDHKLINALSVEIMIHNIFIITLLEYCQRDVINASYAGTFPTSEFQ